MFVAFINLFISCLVLQCVSAGHLCFGFYFHNGFLMCNVSSQKYFNIYNLLLQEREGVRNSHREHGKDSGERGFK